jgi:hypothetical protein
MPHNLINQLRFARSEFVRCLEGISDEDARHRFMPMNCISWMVGHMAAQEQYYFVFFPQGKVPHPQLNELVGFGHPATTPPLDEMWQVWHDITAIADTFLDTVTPDQLTEMKITAPRCSAPPIIISSTPAKPMLFASYWDTLICPFSWDTCRSMMEVRNDRKNLAWMDE